MESKDLEKITIAHAFVLFDKAGPLRSELASELIEECFCISFTDLPMFINTNEYIYFAKKFWECLCQSRFKYGI